MNARALSEPVAPDTAGNTVASCIAKAAGYRFAGVEYGGECYRGNTLTSNVVPLTHCSMPCTGKASEVCGAGNRINIYENTAWQSSTPIINIGISDYRVQGCFSDDENWRSLENVWHDG
jgi:hypothetical protein